MFNSQIQPSCNVPDLRHLLAGQLEGIHITAFARVRLLYRHSDVDGLNDKNGPFRHLHQGDHYYKIWQNLH